MLDSDTKRRIDTARDILVGKVPDPKSQVEQITIALIYKFMNDMDAQSEEMGGKRTFFSDGFSQYRWPALMHSKLGGHEMLNLYAEAITRMPENPNIPALFHNIFKNAYLPYRDPETLKSFLKIINEFKYDHPERLGDAFEYLLSVLGAQGDAGQFRTPRHIIDFMVEIINPQKNEVILDPACGTAGFLISAYKHIQHQNTDKDGNSTLTPDERSRLAKNIHGYDISPDMVRLSLANLYLHGFSAPCIDEYDTLTSEDKWNEYADIIFANPPFMSPKGGIRPHNRFSIPSKRSEVLFVDYIAEHLTPTGRAGVIVPEGIIFKNDKAHKHLRKMLVEEYLIAMISLPAGVFNPYSGVKTNILVMDKVLAKKSDSIAFFKVENDGFDLGAQRRPIDKNDLPQIRTAITDYFNSIRNGELVECNQSENLLVAENNIKYNQSDSLLVIKNKLSKEGEYNLSAEQYLETATYKTEYPIVKIGEVLEVENGEKVKAGLKNYLEIGDINIESKDYDIKTKQKLTVNGAVKVPKNTLLISTVRPTRGAITITKSEVNVSNAFARIKLKNKYFFHILNQREFFEFLGKNCTGATYPVCKKEIVLEYKIPLPPLEIQEQIVAEIDGYQKVIDGARAVVDSYCPHISINPSWPLVELVNILDYEQPTSYIVNSTDYRDEYNIPVLTAGKTFILGHTNEKEGVYPIERLPVIIFDDFTTAKKFVDFPFKVKSSAMKILSIKDKNIANIRFVFHVMQAIQFDASRHKRYWIAEFSKIKIPLPAMEIQQTISSELKSEQLLIAANYELIDRMQAKIQATIARIWGK